MSCVFTMSLSCFIENCWGFFFSISFYFMFFSVGVYFYYFIFITIKIDGKLMDLYNVRWRYIFSIFHKMIYVIQFYNKQFF